MNDAELKAIEDRLATLAGFRAAIVSADGRELTEAEWLAEWKAEIDAHEMVRSGAIDADIRALLAEVRRLKQPPGSAGDATHLGDEFAAVWP